MHSYAEAHVEELSEEEWLIRQRRLQKDSSSSSSKQQNGSAQKLPYGFDREGSDKLNDQREESISLKLLLSLKDIVEGVGGTVRKT